MLPEPLLRSEQDVRVFLRSSACKAIIDFVNALSDSVRGVTISAEVKESEAVKKFTAVLEEVEVSIDKFPPYEVQYRYGNPAFREFHSNLVTISEDLLAPLLPEQYVEEVAAYLIRSFGDQSRIDYGTGHETNFLCVLLCLARLDVLKESDYCAAVLRIFTKYLAIMRKLETTYWLEPAGSRGAWSLDDYHILPFLFGASQLRGHKRLRPKSVCNNEYVDHFSKDYLYFDCIRFVNSIKTESLAWHSPMLYDISGVKTWDKVFTGCLKMYKAEVLGKYPVMQHFLFGEVISYTPPPEGASLDDDVDDEIEEFRGFIGSSIGPATGGGGDACMMAGMMHPSAMAR
eukprot:Rmarinus@m.29574